MDIELLESQAIVGDVEATLDLIMALSKASRFDEALEWAEKLAKAGNPRGKFRAMLLHGLFMDRAQDQLEWDTLHHHASAAFAHAVALTAGRYDGEFEMVEELKKSVAGHLVNGAYYFAVSAYFMDDANTDLALMGIRDYNSPRFRMIRQLLLLDKGNDLWDPDDVVSCMTDRAYRAAEKDTAEELVYAYAALGASVHARHARNDLNRAVALLDLGIAALTDADALDILREERALYHKRLFGGWKFTGEN